MPLKLSRFKLDETLSLVGNMMRVSGLLQLEYPNGQMATRYLLTGGTGAGQILEEQGNHFALLRPFPPAMQPQASADSVTVMGEKYTLAGITKLKVLGTSGQSPGGQPGSDVLLSGKFDGALGTLVREIDPTTRAQHFYALKPVSAADILTADEVAAIQAAEIQRREEQAQARAEAPEESSGGSKLLNYCIVIMVVLGLMYACSDSGDSSSGSVSARSVSGGFHGK
jgi:hypothetical protein